MDSNRIKNVALGARDTLMQEVDAALERVLAPDSPERVANTQAVGTIERTVRDRGRESMVEAVAYTWFNRLCALRYMDVRGYTPVGLVSPRSGETLPAVLADARRGIYAAGLDISQRDKDAINSVLNGDTTARDPLGRAYVMLLVATCKTYERSMDYLFGAGRDLGPAIELLAPTDLLSEGSILQRICAGLDEATCNEGVEVMGWLYQFYVSERKDAFFASKKKATAADIAPATQLFTPNWIVRYLVENSLGRLWMLNFPDSELKDHMEYYVEPKEPEDDFLKIYSPEDITFLDPACGSGHILVYAFDLLYLMYEEEGYRPVDIPELILKNNLTGIEIDDRAAEIASFCLEMKALEKDGSFLDKDIDATIIVTHSFNPSMEERKLAPSFFKDSKVVDDLEHFDQIGSLFIPEAHLSKALVGIRQAISSNGTVEAALLRAHIDDLLPAIEALSQNYAVCVTNPPYMTSSKMSTWLNAWVRRSYPDEKNDLCTCFIDRCIKGTIDGGYSSLITMQSWMFLSSFTKMRTKTLRIRGIVSMAHFGSRAFDAIGGEVVSTVATVFTVKPTTRRAVFLRLVDYGNETEKSKRLKDLVKEPSADKRFEVTPESLLELPGHQIDYWLSDAAKSLLCRESTIGSKYEAGSGLSTSDNERFLRRIWEVSSSRIAADAQGGRKWYFFQKGGGYRKWYGNLEYVVNWENDGEEIKYWVTHNPADPNTTSWSRRIFNTHLYFHEGITWAVIGTGELSFRYLPSNTMISNAAGGIFQFNNKAALYNALGTLNSSVYTLVFSTLNPTVNYSSGVISGSPLFDEDVNCSEIVERCIRLAQRDWDDSETSWGFSKHPLVQASRISDAFQRWERDCRSRFDQLKASEEELNRIFARIYGMEGEVPIEVPDDKVSVRLADLGRDIRSLVSYGVGCMFGRYSLDAPGLILADEGSTLDDYHAKVPNPTFEPDRTGIIPITDADTEWFEDDIVAQFRRWLAAAYGADTLDENVAFIERALGKSLRAYFVRDFYDDHLKTYQKRPIYWLFQSPKKGLSALVYLHRYNPNTVTTLLTEYIRPLREQMEAQVRLLEVTGNARDASTATKYRVTIDELDKWEHDVIFPLSQKHVALSLDDGVKANYGKAEFKGALRKVTGLN